MKRIFTMALAVAVLVQSLGTSAYAASSTSVPDTTVVETVVEEENVASEGESFEEEMSEVVLEEVTTQPESVVEEETVTEETTEPETETVVEADTEEFTETETTTVEEETVSDNEVDEESTEAVSEEAPEAVYDGGTGNYLVDSTLGVTIKDLAVTSGSYHVDFSWIAVGDYSGNYSGYNTYMIYTDDATLGADFFQGVTSVTSSELWNKDFQYASYTEYDNSYLYNGDEGYESGYECRKWDMVYAPYDLKPNTTYYYRLAQYDYSDSTYKLLTLPGSFTTKPAVETTAVTYKDIHVEETGYGTAKLVWDLVNPNNEYITSSDYAYYVDKNGTFENAASAYVYEYQDEDYNKVPGRYYAEIPLNSDEIKVKIEHNVYTGDRVKTPVESEETIVKRKDIDTAAITKNVEAGTASIAAKITMTPFYEVDDYELSLELYYRVKTEDNSQSYSNVSADILDGTGSLTATGLTQKTEYEYYLQIVNDDGAGVVIWNDGSSEKPYTISTSEIVTYKDSDFPDAVFREAVKSKAGVASTDALTSDTLEKVTELSLSVSSLGKEIKSIEGAQYLVNLKEINLEGQSVTDAEPLKNLKKLEEIDLDYNDFTEMPDLSQVISLQQLSLYNNLILKSSITADKLPATFLAEHATWISQTRNAQRGAFSYKLPNTFYAIGEKYPFFIYVDGIKGSRDYTFSVTIGGKTATTTKNLYGSGYMVIGDLSSAGIAMQPGDYTATISLEDELGNIYITEKTVDFTMEADIPVVEDERYIDSTATSTWIYTYMPGYISASDVKKIELLDASDNVVGNGVVDDTYHYSQDYRYDDFYCYDLSCVMTKVECDISFAKFLSAGDYKFKVTMADGTVYDMGDVVHVTGRPIITSVYVTGEYDNFGDYVHVSVNGYNLDKDKVYPVLYFNGDAITGSATAIKTYSSTYIYKLKKINKETVWNDGFEGECQFKFVTADGYSVENKCSNDSVSVYLNGLVLFEHYNYKKKTYEVFLNSSIPEGTEVEVSVCTSSTYNTVEATATAKVKNGGLSLSFVNGNGDAYVPPKDVFKYFKYCYELDGAENTYTNQKRIEWYNYSTSVGDSSLYIYRGTVLYQESMMKELDIEIDIPKTLMSTNELQAQIYTAKGTPIGNALTLSKSSVTIGGTPYFECTGTWKDETGLGEGIYVINYLQDGVTVTSDTLYVYDNSKFYTNNQYGSIQKDGTGTLYFYSEQLYGNYINKYNSKVSDEKALEIWKNNYNLEIFDRYGNEITGWKINSAYYRNSYFYAYFSGLPSGYTGFYFRITDKNGNPAIRLSDGKVFYEVDSDSTVELGKWASISSRSVYTQSDNSSLHAYYGISTSYADMFPVTVTFIRPYDSTVIKTFKVNSSNTSYNFTSTDLSGIASNEVYRILLTAATGESSTYTGYFAVRGSSSGTVAATGVTLDKTTINMQPKETVQLSATVKPSNVTNSTVTWSTSDGAVATVNNSGLVTAVGTGTATITATTHNGKTAKCTVNVYSYKISAEIVTLDLSDEEPSVVLVINNGIADITTVTWSSRDNSVASVDKNGKVTATGVGSTIIDGLVKNGPTLSCNVTVERSALEKITLSDESIELDKGMSQNLTVYYVPNDVTCDKTIIWTTSDDTVASVDETGKVTAKAKGTAVITATVKDTEIAAQCTIKVFDTVDEEQLVVPSGLTALTNVDKTLGDVSLEAFEGWSWREEDKEIELSKFSGMQEKAFVACYHKDEETKPVYKVVNVKLSTVTGIALSAERSSLLTGENMEVNMTWNMTGNEYDMSEYENSITWNSTKPSVATVSGNEMTVTVEAIAKGKAKVEASVEIGGKLYKAKTNVSVLEGKHAQIDVTDVSGMVETIEGSGSYTGNKATLSSGTITVALTDAQKLTVKSGNTKVIAVKKAVVNEDGTFSIPYEVKAAGTAKILLTANDALKTCKEIVLQVKDAEPSVSVKSVKVNRLSESGATFDVYPGPDAEIKAVELIGEGKDFFVVAYDKETKKCNITTVDENTSQGKYSAISLQVTYEDENIEAWSMSLPITVEEKKPSFKVKQSKKVNLFMDKDLEEAKLNIAASDDVISMKLDNCDFVIKEGNGEYFVAAKENGLSTKCTKKGTLTVEFENYRGEYTYNYTVGLERKAPKITANSKTYVLYPAMGINEAKVTLSLNKETFVVNEENIKLEGTADYDLAVEGDYIILTRTNTKQTGKVKATLVIADSRWVESIKVPITLSVNMKNPKVKLSKTSIQLNPECAAFDTAPVKVMWKDGAAFEPYKITISAANKASQSVLNKEICFDIDDEYVIAKLNNVKAAKATYKYKVNVTPIEGAKEISTNLTVKVVPTELSKAVKISAKGNIDVLNRDGSKVTVTPSLKGINGDIVEAKLGGAFGHLFEEPVIEGGKVYIYAKDDVSLITKYNYPVTLKLTLENEDGETIDTPTTTIKIKCKQGKAKITATPKNSVFYSNAYNSVNIDLKATLKGAADPQISAVELLNETKAFTCAYDTQKQRITVTMKDNGEAVKNKTYTLQFKVSLDGQADNEKVTVIKYKVTVK